MPEPSLLIRTRQLLGNRPRTLTLRRIAEDTGIKLYTLSRVSTGESADPGVSIIQPLYEYLAGHPLELR